jgi:FkbH-like protein
MRWSGPVLMQLAGEHVRHLRAYRGLVRRCLVLDPDGTLWGGVVSECGIAGVGLSTHPPDNAYLLFQHELLGLWDRGMLLAICSRNLHVESANVFDRHPSMLVRSGHLAARRVNTRTKPENLADIAAELDIGLDSLVFWDHDPDERTRMRTSLPQVLTPEVPPDPAHYGQALIEVAGLESLVPGRRT